MKLWVKALFSGMTVVAVLFFVSHSRAIEIENSGAMPYQLDTELIKDIWKEVVRVVNEEAVLSGVPKGAKPPAIRYRQDPPPEFRGSRARYFYCWDDRGLIALDGSRYCRDNNGQLMYIFPRRAEIYKYAFFREPALENLVPGLAESALAHEFMHEAMAHQRIAPIHHHCLMISSSITVGVERIDILRAVLRFVEARLGSGSKESSKLILKETKEACQEERRILTERQ